MEANSEIDSLFKWKEPPKLDSLLKPAQRGRNFPPRDYLQLHYFRRGAN